MDAQALLLRLSQGAFIKFPPIQPPHMVSSDLESKRKVGGFKVTIKANILEVRFVRYNNISTKVIFASHSSASAICHGSPLHNYGDDDIQPFT